jgi:hypothetical protein
MSFIKDIDKIRVKNLDPGDKIEIVCKYELNFRIFKY